MNPFRYRGYIFDEETGLYYLRSRYYNPNLCRFINADDVEALGADGDINGYQLFMLYLPNPISTAAPNLWSDRRKPYAYQAPEKRDEA